MIWLFGKQKKVSAEALTCAFFGGPSVGRNLDLGIKSPLIYQLS